MWEAEKDENLGGPAKGVRRRSMVGNPRARWSKGTRRGQESRQTEGWFREVWSGEGDPGKGVPKNGGQEEWSREGAPKNGGQGRVVQGRGPEVSICVVPDKI